MRIYLTILLLILCSINSNIGYAASMGTADQTGGYSGQVLDKLAGYLALPNVKNNVSVKIRIELDDQGALVRCLPIRTSGYPAVDAAACNSVVKAAPFASPPYSLPIEVYLTIWTGSVKSVPSNQVMQRPVQQAQPQAVIPTPSAQQENINTQPVQQSQIQQPTQQPQSQQVVLQQPANPVYTVGNLPAGIKAQDAYGPQYSKYFSRIVHKLRDATFIPIETVPGTYYATVRLNVDAQGNIKNSTLMQSSGDTKLDKYVLQGIKRAQVIEAPPQGLSKVFDVTLTLVRQ